METSRRAFLFGMGAALAATQLPLALPNVSNRGNMR